MVVTIPVRDKGRLFLPRALREAAGIRSGDELVARVEDGRLILEPRTAILGRLRGALVDDDDRSAGEIVRDERARDQAMVEAKQARIARRVAETSDDEITVRGNQVLRALGLEP